MFTTAARSYLWPKNFSFDGGLLSDMFSRIAFVNNSNNLSVQMGNIDYINYIISYFFNYSKLISKFDANTSLIIDNVTISNQNFIPSIFWLIYIAVPFLFCLLFCLFWIVWQATRSIPRLQIFYHKILKNFPTYWENTSSYNWNISVFSEDDIQKKRKKFLNKTIIFSSISIILAFAFVICFVICVISGVSVQNKLVNTSNNDSLSQTWKLASENVDIFFNRILVDSYQMFNNSLDSISTSIQSLLQSSLNNLTSNLMTEFGVTDLFITLTNLLSNLNGTVNSMNFITTNSRGILSEIDQLKGKFSVYQENLQKSFKLVCNELPNNMQCQQYYNDTSLLFVPISTSNINTESSINMNFILQNFRLNLSQLKTQVENMQSTLNGQILEITNTKVRELNIGQSINDVRNLWNHISSSIAPVKTQCLETFGTISNVSQSGASILIIISSVILVLILVFVGFYLFSIVRYLIIYYYERVILVDNINAPPTRPIFVLHHLKKQRVMMILKQYFTSPRWVIYTYLVIFSLILILLIILSFLIVSAGDILHHEACVQLWNPAGMENTDKIISNFLTTHWNSINSIVRTMISVPITITKPTRILQSIMHNCTNDTGLLHVLRWTNLINISSFVWSPQNVKTLQSGLNLTYDTIIKLDTKYLMPPDMTSFLGMATNITKYFDEIDYTTTISELSKGVLVMDNVTLWLQNSVDYFSSLRTEKASMAVTQLQTIQSVLPTITSVQSKLDILRENYVQIQGRRVNNQLISQLRKGLESTVSYFVPSSTTYNIVAKAYSAIMLTNFTIQTDMVLTKEIRLLMGKLFPCNNVPKAFSLILSNLCNNDEIIEILVNDGLVLTVLSVFLILMFQFFWKLVRIDFIDNDEKNISTC